MPGAGAIHPICFRADCVCFTSRSTTLREKLIKIGAKVVSHGRYVTFQLADVAVLRDLFRDILRLIDELRPKPAPT